MCALSFIMIAAFIYFLNPQLQAHSPYRSCLFEDGVSIKVGTPLNAQFKV
jgi:hypothetical protein